MRASILMMIVGMFLAAAPNIAAADDNSGKGKNVRVENHCHVSRSSEYEYTISALVKTKGIYYGFDENGRNWNKPIPNYKYWEIQCDVNTFENTYDCTGVNLDLDDVAANKINVPGTLRVMKGLRVDRVLHNSPAPFMKWGLVFLRWGIYKFTFGWNIIDNPKNRAASFIYETTNGAEKGKVSCEYSCWDDTAPEGKEHECATKR